VKTNLQIKNSIHKNYLKKNFNKKLSGYFNKYTKEIINNIDLPREAYNVLSNDFKFDFNFKDIKRFKKFKTITIIGMGGSILGTEAIYNCFKKKIKKKVYFFDDINSEKIQSFKKKINIGKTLFLIISKSGNTIETLTNFLSINIIKKNSKNIILISEKNNNILFSLAKKFNLFYIEHKKHIGGRYSVLSEVGIVPAYLMGINIIKLRKNLKKYLINKEKNLLKDSSIKLTNLLHQARFTNLIFLNYIPQLEKFLYWCQQLIAESLGKNAKGFLPVVSSAPKDHHSLLQLYLDGPKDKIFYIFSFVGENSVKVKTKKATNRINYLHNKRLDQIKIAQKNALIKSLIKKKIPYREFKINYLNEETLGELISYYILETIFIGKLCGINPYDQPAVEKVKQDTYKILN
jgi:glucose-6-phosphate isomerase